MEMGKLVECRKAIINIGTMVAIGAYGTSKATELIGDFDVDERKYPMSMHHCPASIIIDFSMSSKWMIYLDDNEIGIAMSHETPDGRSLYGLCEFPCHHPDDGNNWVTNEEKIPGTYVDALLAIHQLMQL